MHALQICYRCTTLHYVLMHIVSPQDSASLAVCYPECNYTARTLALPNTQALLSLGGLRTRFFPQHVPTSPHPSISGPSLKFTPIAQITCKTYMYATASLSGPRSVVEWVVVFRVSRSVRLFQGIMGTLSCPVCFLVCLLGVGCVASAAVGPHRCPPDRRPRWGLFCSITCPYLCSSVGWQQYRSSCCWFGMHEWVLRGLGCVAASVRHNVCCFAVATLIVGHTVLGVCGGDWVIWLLVCVVATLGHVIAGVCGCDSRSSCWFVRLRQC